MMTESQAASHAESAMKLAYMAGQIADFFKAYPEEEAIASIAEHINKFWSKRMRMDFLAHFAAGDGRLHPLVGEAISQIRGGGAVQKTPET